MSIYQQQTEVERFPAYIIYRREQARDGYVEITSQDRLGLKSPRGYYKEFAPGSVVSYALQYNEDPIQAVAEAASRGHALRWINPCASVITSHKREPATLIEVTIGMKVRFEGFIATIQPDHNNNLKFVPT